MSAWRLREMNTVSHRHPPPSGWSFSLGALLSAADKTEPSISESYINEISKGAISLSVSPQSAQ